MLICGNHGENKIFLYSFGKGKSTSHLQRIRCFNLLNIYKMKVKKNYIINNKIVNTQIRNCVFNIFIFLL